MNLIRALLSTLYGLAINVRHKLFDWKVLRSWEPDVPVVCVGNLTVGGTGKTPVVEFLVGSLGNRFTLAVLSRGYGRKTKGYLEVERNMSFRTCGDEPKQIKRKFPDTLVVVCENRRLGIREIRRRHPEINLILMDDGFQHRYVVPKVNILLMDYNRPVWRDHLLPWGGLRDSISQLYRANYIVATKCPAELNPLDRRIVLKWLGLYPYQTLWFTRMENLDPVPIFPDKAVKGQMRDVVVMAGIGNPQPLVETLRKRYRVAGELIFADHHPYRVADLKKMSRALENAPAGTVIVTTEKDAVKLTNARRVPEALQERLFYLPVQLGFPDGNADEFIRKLINDVRTVKAN